MSNQIFQRNAKISQIANKTRQKKINVFRLEIEQIFETSNISKSKSAVRKPEMDSRKTKNIFKIFLFICTNCTAKTTK